METIRRETEADPASYRLQVRSYTEKQCTCGSQARFYGPVLWEEPAGTELTQPVPMRWQRAELAADAVQAEHRCNVAVGTVALWSDHTFCEDHRRAFRPEEK